jgi:hypothetical protein
MVGTGLTESLRMIHVSDRSTPEDIGNPGRIVIQYFQMKRPRGLLPNETASRFVLSADASLTQEPRCHPNKKHENDHGRVLHVTKHLDGCAVSLSSRLTVIFLGRLMATVASVSAIAVGVVWWD